METTQIYTRVAIPGLKKIHHKTHPREKDYRREIKLSGSFWHLKKKAAEPPKEGGMAAKNSLEEKQG